MPTDFPTADTHDRTAATQLVDESVVVVPVVREEVSVGKRVVATERVDVAKTVEVDEVELDLETRHRGYDVERRAVHSMHDVPPEPVRREGDATIYAVVREVPVVVTRYELVEEVVVRPVATAETHPSVVPARRERIDIVRRPLT